MEYALPVFAGALCALFICIFLAAHYFFSYKPAAAQEFVQEISGVEAGKAAGEINLSGIFASPAVIIPDFILEKYRSPEYREWVINFFTEICGSREIAQAILTNTDRFDVSPALAFALSWEESRFNPRAVNRANQNQSVDRGLFQLNSFSFPYLEINAFFDINENARLGIEYLRRCLDAAGYEIGGLAMYNAGQNRVRNMGTPKVTLHYVHRILENRRRIEENFRVLFQMETETRLAKAAANTKAYKEDKEEQGNRISAMRFHFARIFISASPL